MKEEDFIRRKCGNRDPFKVPEGYFEQFTARLMEQLPEKDSPGSMQPRRYGRQLRLTFIRYAVAAAVVCGIIAFDTLRLTNRHSNAEGNAVATYTPDPADTDDAYIEDALDYAMVSNNEIALYLTEAY